MANIPKIPDAIINTESGKLTEDARRWFYRLFTQVNSNTTDTAPVDAKYIVQTSNATLTGEQALASLNSGLVTVTTGSGVLNSRTLTGTSNQITITDGTGAAGNPTVAISNTYAGQTSITTLGTITTATYQGSSIATTYTDAKIKTVTGTVNRLTVGGTATDPTFDISANYIGQNTITTLGTVATGTWSATTIGVDKGGTGQTSYTNGQLLIGNTTGNTLTKSTLTSGSDISITNGGGSITVSRPLNNAFSAAQGTSQSISASTWTKVQYATENFDTDNTYDNSTNYRHTPTVAGKYLYTAKLNYEAFAGANKAALIAFYKNGVQYDYVQTKGNAAGDTPTTLHITELLDMNGSTDYVEVYTLHVDTGSVNIVASTAQNIFTGIRIGV